MGKRKERYRTLKRNSGRFKKKSDKNLQKTASRIETEHEDPEDPRPRPRFEYDIRPVAQLVADKEENCEKPFDVLPNAVIDVPAVTIKTEDPLDCEDNSEYNIIIEDATIQDNEFPQDPESASNWIDATGRKNRFPTKNSTICSSHFLETDHNEINKARRLFPQACPTIDIWNAPSTSTVETTISHSGIAGEEVHITEERDDDTESMIIEISLKNEENSAAQDKEKIRNIPSSRLGVIKTSIRGCPELNIENTNNPVITFNRLEYVKKLKLQLSRSQKALELKERQVKKLRKKLYLRNKKIEELEEYITKLEHKTVVSLAKKRASKDR